MRCDFQALNKCVFKMLCKLSVAGDLSYSSRYTVPHTRSCESKTSVAMHNSLNDIIYLWA